MREIKNTIWVGAWLIILPFFGIPSAWKEWLVILTGALILGASFVSFRHTGRAAPQKEVVADTYRENGEKPVVGSKDAV